MSFITHPARKSHIQAGTRRRNSQDYQLLEKRLPLTTFLVNSLVDDGSGTPDGSLSLREAIMAANTNAPFGDAPAGDANGDRIQFEVPVGSTFVLTGGQIRITDDLLIQGGDDQLTIDGSNNDRLFEIESPEHVVFGKLTFTGGNANRGGAFLVSGSPLTVLDSVFESNTSEGAGADGGGAVYVTGGVLPRGTFSSFDSVFRNNIAKEGNGGAIYTEAGRTSITGGGIYGNEATFLGGGLAVSTGELFLNDVNLGDEVEGGNFASFKGGGIHAGNSAFVSISGGKLEQNTSRIEGGAISAEQDSEVRLRQTLLSNNRILSGHDGHAIYVTGGKINASGVDTNSNIYSILSDLRFRDSVVSSSFPAGSNDVSLRMFRGSASLVNTNVDSNIEIANGARLLINGGSVSDGRIRVVGTDSILFVRNGAEITGTVGEFNLGGAIFSEDARVVVSDSTISGGSTSRGGAIYSIDSSLLVSNSTVAGETGDQFDGAGGAVAIYNGFASITNSNLQGTANRSGGALYSLNSQVQMAGGSVSDSTSLFNGGGIFLNNTNAVMNAVLISGNTANNSGGGMYMFAGTLRLNDATISSNTSSEAGGGLASHGSAILFVRDTTVSNNAGISSTDGAKGGGFHISKSTLRLSNSTFTGNESNRGGGMYVTNIANVGINGGSFSGNDARGQGGGLLITMASEVFLRGAVAISNNTTSGTGAGISFRTFNAGFLSAIGASFTGNHASGNGGGIYIGIEGEAFIKDSRFEQNDGGSRGGAIHNSGELRVLDSELIENQVTISGGAIYNTIDAVFSQLNNTFAGNTPNDIN